MSSRRVLVWALVPSALSLLMGSVAMASPSGFQLTSPMSSPHLESASVLLSDGRVLTTGGHTTTGEDLATAEIFDEKAMLWTPTDPLPAPMSEHVMVVLPSQSVLAVGYVASQEEVQSTIWDPSSGHWTPMMDVVFAFQPARQSARVTSDGRVLFATAESALLFDPTTSVWSTPTTASPLTNALGVFESPMGIGWVLDGKESSQTSAQSLTLMTSTWGQDFPWVSGYPLTPVLGVSATRAVAMGTSASQNGMGTDNWRHVLALDFGAAMTAPIPSVLTSLPEAVLSPGIAALDATHVLAAGGLTPAGIVSRTTALVDLSASTAAYGAQLSEPRLAPNAIVLADGSVLIVGGDRAFVQQHAASSAELCAQGQCGPACTLSTDCATGISCVGGACTGPLPDVSECDADAQCASGNCNLGACCPSSCHGPCVSCVGTVTGLTDGVCGAAPAGAPSPQCPVSSDVCGATGKCDGLGSCAFASSGITCPVSQHCTGGTYVEGLCDGTGACEQVVEGSCDFLACNETDGCTMQCSTSQPCGTGGTCKQGQCLETNVMCLTAADCMSGHCVAGLCCDSECDGPCVSCAPSATGLPAGTCGPVLQGVSASGCEVSLETCGSLGTCDGLGACAFRAAGTDCAAACESGSFVRTTCDGLGACAVKTTYDCGFLACHSPTGCSPECDAPDACGPSGHCLGGSCRAQLGTACAIALNLCETGDCVLGVCCDGPCDDACQSCALPGFEGTCMPTQCPSAGGASGVGGAAGSESGGGMISAGGFEGTLGIGGHSMSGAGHDAAPTPDEPGATPTGGDCAVSADPKRDLTWIWLSWAIGLGAWRRSRSERRTS